MKHQFVASTLLGFFLFGCQTGSSNREPGLVEVVDATMVADSNTSLEDMGTSADMTAPDDMAVPQTSCDDMQVLDYQELAVEDADDDWVLESTFSSLAQTEGSCGGTGNERAFLFTAPAPGTWLFTVEAEDSMLDTVLYARSDCDDISIDVNDNKLSVKSDILPSCKAKFEKYNHKNFNNKSCKIKGKDNDSKKTSDYCKKLINKSKETLILNASSDVNISREILSSASKINGIVDHINSNIFLKNIGIYQRR